MRIHHKSKTLVRFFRFYVGITGLFVTFLMLFDTNASLAYKYYFLIPFVYSLAIVSSRRLTYNINHIGMMTLQAVMWVKYVLMPFVNCLADYTLWRGISPNDVFIEASVFLTLYEMLAVLLTISVFQGKIYGSYREEQINVPKRVGIYIVVVILAMMIIIISPNLTSRYRYVFSTDLGHSLADEELWLYGLWATVVDFGRLILLLLIISYCKSSYDKRRRLLYVIIAILSAITYLLFSLGISRWSIATPGLILTYMMMQLFEKHRKFILTCVGAVILVGLGVMSSIRMVYVDMIPSSTLWADLLQMYFSGPKNIAFAIETKKYINATYGYFPLNVLLNDFFRSVAGFSQFTNSEASTIGIFNAFVYGHTNFQDQIIPLMGQSFIYFGYFLAPLLTVVATIVMMYLDKKSYESTDIVKYYIFAYTAVWYARAMMLNATILFSHFTNTFCLFMIVKWINDHIVFVKKDVITKS